MPTQTTHVQLADLVAAIYDEVSANEPNQRVAARLTAKAVVDTLVRSGRPDLVARLTDAERATAYGTQEKRPLRYGSGATIISFRKAA